MDIVHNEFPKIETLFERDPNTHKVVLDKLKNPVYETINIWEWTEKVDGTNVQLVYHPPKNSFNTMVAFKGRTDNAQIPTDLITKLSALVKIEKWKEVFGSAPAVVYGEGYGAGIQKGDGYRQDKSLIVFDIVINGYWLNHSNVVDICTKLELETVPFIGRMTIQEASTITMNGFDSRIPGAERKAEGLVGRTIEPLFDALGHRLIVKLKTKDF